MEKKMQHSQNEQRMKIQSAVLQGIIQKEMQMGALFDPISDHSCLWPCYCECEGGNWSLLSKGSLTNSLWYKL